MFICYPFAFVLFILLDHSNAKIQYGHWDDVGEKHNEAINRLAEKYSIEKPASITDTVHDIIEISSSYCSQEDSSLRSNCQEKAYEYAVKAATNIPRGIEFPSGFDSRVKHSLDTISSIIDLASDLEVDEIVELISQEKKHIEEISRDNKVNEIILHVGTSVAIHSTRLWKEVMSDPQHPLHTMGKYYNPDHHGRYLQGQEDAICADYEIAVQTVLDLTEENPYLILTVPALAPFLITSAVPVSLLAFLLGNDDEKDETFFTRS